MEDIERKKEEKKVPGEEKKEVKGDTPIQRVEETKKEISLEDTFKNILQEGISAFSLNLTNLELFDIKPLLDEIRLGKRRILAQLDLSGNQLMELDLDNLPNLYEFKASKNCLQRISLNLPSLQVLDLSNNSFDSFPGLFNLVKLDKLYLGKNNISKWSHEVLPISLSYLDVSDNHLSFTVEEFESFLKSFQRFKFLHELIIDKNEFNRDFPNYILSIGKLSSSIRLINRNQAMKEVEEGKAGKTDKKEEKQEVEKKLAREKVLEAFPSLDSLCDHVRKARKFPPSCQSELAELGKKTEDLLAFSDKARIDQEYAIPSLLKDFYEEMSLLYSSQPKYRKEITMILARLSTQSHIGEYVIDLLINLMKSSMDLNRDIKEILKKYIVHKLTFAEEAKDLQQGLLERLCKVADEVDIGSILAPLMNPFFKFIKKKEELENPTILGMLVKIMALGIKGDYKCLEEIITDKTGRKEGLESEAKEEERKEDKEEKGIKMRHIDSFAVLIRGLFIKPSMVDLEGLEIESTVGQYISVLLMIEHSARKSKTVATAFCSKFYGEFLAVIEESLAAYASLTADKQESASSRRAIIVCETTAAEIFAFSGILNTTEKKHIEDILKHPKTDVLKGILSLATQPRVDPKVLAAACTFAHALFQQPVILESESKMKLYVGCINKVHGLIEFLQGKKWNDLCKASTKYHPGMTKGQESIPLADVKQKFMFDALKSIVELINFFAKQSRNTKLPCIKLLYEINHLLDQAQCEDALFATLKVQSDEVKLAVIMCLNNIPLTQFQAPEMGRMVSLLSQYKNPTVGKTEIVLGQLLWLLTKIVLDPTKEVGLEFIKTQAKTAVKETMFIFERNQQREVDPEEEREKSYLSISAVLFLKCCSTIPELKTIISSNSTKYSMLLKTDERGEKTVQDHYPILVERTALGSSIINNLEVFIGKNQPDQYSDVCLRVLQTMADVLSGQHVYEIEEVFPEQLKDKKINLGDPMDLMRDYIIKFRGLSNEKEGNHWPTLNELLKTDSANINSPTIQKEIQVFLDNDIMEIILDYLMGKSASKCEYDLDVQLEKFSKDKFEKMNLETNIPKKVEKFRKRFLTKMKSLQETKEKKEEKKVEERKKGEGQQAILKALVAERLAFNVKRTEPIIDRGISLQHEPENKEKKDSHSGLENDKGNKKHKNINQRAIVIAAFLRCLFNVYAYGNYKQKSELTKRLRNKYNLKMLTQLCFTTDWVEANVGAKYLRLCYLVLKLEPESNYASNDMVILDEIVCVAAREILDIMFNKIKNEDKVPFSLKENLLFFELSRFGQTICNQVPYLQYFTMGKTEETEEQKIEVEGVTPMDSPQDFSFFFLPPQLKNHGEYVPTPQLKCSQFILRQLLPFKSMFTFILMLFYYSRKQEETRTMSPVEERIRVLSQVEQARTTTILALGNYMSIVKQDKYNFLEEIMKQCIYEKKSIRKSYVQEILSCMHRRLIAGALEAFIFENYLKKKGEKERVIELYECEYAVEGAGHLKSAYFAFTSKSIYFFAPMTRRCPKCRLERVCWEPIPLQDPIPLTSIDILIDIECPQLLGLTYKSGVSVFSGDVFTTVFILFYDLIAKGEMIKTLQLLHSVKRQNDVMFDKFFKDIIREPSKSQVLSISLANPPPKKTLISSEPKLENPYFLVVAEGNLRFFRYNIKHWKSYVKMGETEKKGDKEAVARELRKKQEEKAEEEKKKDMDLRLKAMLIEDKKLNRSINDINMLSEKEDKEPTLRVTFKSGEFFITFSSDFSLQEFINSIAPNLSK